MGNAGQANYAASKAGILYLTRMAALEGAPHGIRVNCVCPGWTRTPMALPECDDADVLRHVCATMALQKIATPEDVAAEVRESVRIYEGARWICAPSGSICTRW